MYVPVDHNCGAWNTSIDVFQLTGTLSVTPVADDYPEQIVTARPGYVTRPSAC